RHPIRRTPAGTGLRKLQKHGACGYPDRRLGYGWSLICGGVPMSKPKRVAIYVRVSTDAQSTKAQRQELEAWAGRAGHTVVGVYEDQGISGAKGARAAPAVRRAAEGRHTSRVQHDRRLVLGPAGTLTEALGRGARDHSGHGHRPLHSHAIR